MKAEIWVGIPKCETWNEKNVINTVKGYLGGYGVPFVFSDEKVVSGANISHVVMTIKTFDSHRGRKCDGEEIIKRVFEHVETCFKTGKHMILKLEGGNS